MFIIKNLKERLENIYKKIGIKSVRSRNISNHVLLSFLYMGGGVLANYLLVPLTMNYLNNKDYGLWLTLISFISWFSFFDIGLGNGLRNKFAEAKAIENKELIKGYISTAYYTISLIIIGLIILFLAFNFFINWSYLFNISSARERDLKILIPVVFIFFCLQMILKLITTIYIADQNHSMQNKVQFYTQFLSLVLIWVLIQTAKKSLLIFGLVFSFLPVFILLIINIIAFSGKYADVRPCYSFCKKEYLSDIFGVGISFFIIQIATIVLFSTDNLIITRLFSPEDVVPYNVAFKYFSILSIGYSILVAPYWSSFTEAYFSNDIVWIKKSIKNVTKIWLMVPVVLTIMIICAEKFYAIWLGKKVEVSLFLNVTMALFVAMTTFNMVFINFINGVGKIRLQLFTSIVSIIINIPVSIFFAKYLNLGIGGVMLGTCFCLLYSVILRPLQTYKIITNTAKGVWNK